ncbi:Site-specific recombinase XerD [Sphingomonas laterariae]|uniref:Site-specific recombinase XerD n=1 Tax=Edaphosphingomonas laterariae TaxID=861865 RepID=A0A239FBZ4_9SPHN|nr:tyrosine-type recombinase/integrase [Sphingomonas laterariae]SNS54018.1 Site-specific recombinase XerD [Sphingomonas laterariae]
MAKRRFLPKHVTAFSDRHGKERLRFRRKGFPDHYFKAPFGTDEFGREYRACMEALPPAAEPIGEARHAPGTFHDLIARYYASARWNAAKRSEQTRTHDRRILEAFRAEHGHRTVAGLSFAHAEKMLAKKADTPTAANKLRKQLKRLVDYGVLLKMRSDNPFDLTEPMAAETGGHHTWSEDDIARFVVRHPLGSKAYLAMMLMLWTGARRCDVVRLGRQNVKAGRLTFTPLKTKKTTQTTLHMPIAPQLAAAIAAAPGTGGMTFLATAYGVPFTANGFGNWFRDRCDEAGLPNCSAHGLRKAISRRLAEINQGNQSIKSVTGHSSDSEVARYTREASRALMAEQAMGALSDWEMSNLPPKVRQKSE